MSNTLIATGDEINEQSVVIIKSDKDHFEELATIADAALKLLTDKK